MEGEAVRFTEPRDLPQPGGSWTRIGQNWWELDPPKSYSLRRSHPGGEGEGERETPWLLFFSDLPLPYLCQIYLEASLPESMGHARIVLSVIQSKQWRTRNVLKANRLGLCRRFKQFAQDYRPICLWVVLWDLCVCSNHVLWIMYSIPCGTEVLRSDVNHFWLHTFLCPCTL